jgi:hypothetical protein
MMATPRSGIFQSAYIGFLFAIVCWELGKDVGNVRLEGCWNNCGVQYWKDVCCNFAAQSQTNQKKSNLNSNHFTF